MVIQPRLSARKWADIAAFALGHHDELAPRRRHARPRPGKATALLKDAVLKAAETAGGGGPDGLVSYLVAQAKQNPGPLMTLLGKVLRHQPGHFRIRSGDSALAARSA
jgi:hypothetical protein